jgi:hypothetical protein
MSGCDRTQRLLREWGPAQAPQPLWMQNPGVESALQTWTHEGDLKCALANKHKVAAHIDRGDTSHIPLCRLRSTLSVDY